MDLSGHVAVDLGMSGMDGMMSEMEASGGSALVMAGHRGVEDATERLTGLREGEGVDRRYKGGK